MYKIIYAGAYTAEISECVANFENISLQGVILDESLSESELAEERQYLNSKNIHELKFDDIPTINPDIIFLCSYNKLLKTDLLDKYLFVNVHAGILPKWRGFNSNCWAILNGENKIGYTLHRVREGMDDGEIFDVTEIELEPEESYFSARRRIKKIFCQKLEETFLNIIEGKIIGKVQPKNGIVYNCKLRVSDAIITDWNQPSVYLVGLFRVFCEGSGVFIKFRQKNYKVLKMGYAEEIAISKGIAGAIINNYNDGAVLIKCLDTAVKIYELEDENGLKILPSDIFKIGIRV